ncbi:MAG: MBL fold metallo-hydrolase [Bacillota bacterium]
MLNFIGTGSAFNTRLGNNSAFIKSGSSILLIDCGGATFSRLQKFDILSGISHIYVLITHLHPDHVGSLGDLVFYSFYKAHHKIFLMTPASHSLEALLTQMGIDKNLYNMVDLKYNNCITSPEMDVTIEYFKAEHVSNLYCYSYMLTYDGKSIYYSGDSNNISSEILEKLYSNKIDYLYQDIFMAPHKNLIHMSFDKLCSLIKSEYRHKVFCMHLNEEFDAELALSAGFKVVQGPITDNEV